ncbi:hypothetical protein EOD39_10499 [Acipenser ruthenus]|uniref:Uncharacterized protein n=1 Tax=Acipenser ruthenus TaxID=7906 RepID=A0A444TXU0_ACIRT|nr:hypothetical protein EOD39_10499 [Acipenser ruthenus]
MVSCSGGTCSDVAETPDRGKSGGVIGSWIDAVGECSDTDMKLSSKPSESEEEMCGFDASIYVRAPKQWNPSCLLGLLKDSDPSPVC